MSREPLRVVSPSERQSTLRRGVYILPNLFTTGGLVSGFYSVILTLSGQYEMAAFMILVAHLFDGLDGRIARLTRTTSRFGVEYDSLADLIAFGVAPGILVYEWALKPWGTWGWLAASLYVTCGALRLARFNVQVDLAEKRAFTGMPIPAAADMVASTVLALLPLRRRGRDAQAHHPAAPHLRARDLHGELAAVLQLQGHRLAAPPAVLAADRADRRDQAPYRAAAARALRGDLALHGLRTDWWVHA